MKSVIRRGGGPIGTSGLVAVAALVVLLGAGLGVLGGRPEATERPAAASTDAAARVADPTFGSPAPGRTPLVTPAARCGPLPPDGPPGVMLTVDDHLMAARVDVVDGDADPSRAPDRDPIEVAADAIADIRIAAGACATGWHIALWSPSDGELYPVEIMPNPDADPNVALQNEFELVLTPFRDLRGEELELRAAFDLSDRSIVARWPVRLQPFEWPQPRLVVRPDVSVSTVAGCDTVLTFRNGYEERDQGCEGDLSAEPPEATRLRPGTEMSLKFDGWSIGDTIAFCGATSDLAFLVTSPPACEQHPPHGKSFTAPSPGDWTMAIGACAVNAGNRICGTWYANVDTR